MPHSWHPVPACTPRLCCRRAVLSCSSDGAAAILKSGLEIKNRCIGGVVAFCRRNRSSSRQRKLESYAEGRCREPLQAEPFLFAATKIRIGRGSSLPRRALQAGNSSLLRRWCCCDSQIDPFKSRITAHWRAFPGKNLQRFASLGMKSRIDAAFGLFPGKTLHRFSNLGLNLRIDAVSGSSSAHPPARVPSVAPARVLPWMFAWERARRRFGSGGKSGC